MKQKDSTNDKTVKYTGKSESQPKSGVIKQSFLWFF